MNTSLYIRVPHKGTVRTLSFSVSVLPNPRDILIVCFRDPDTDEEVTVQGTASVLTHYYTGSDLGHVSCDLLVPPYMVRLLHGEKEEKAGVAPGPTCD